MNETFEDKIKIYQKNRTKHSQNWKKIKALVHYSRTLNCFKEWEALEYLVRYFSNHFLDHEDEAWMDKVLKRYKINYLDWWHLTPWVKNRIAASASKKKNYQQLHFWFDDLEKNKFVSRVESPLWSKINGHKLYFKETI